MPTRSKAQAADFAIPNKFIVRKRSGAPSNEHGHAYRERHNTNDGDVGCDAHKYGKQKQKIARQRHWQSYMKKRAWLFATFCSTKRRAPGSRNGTYRYLFSCVNMYLVLILFSHQRSLHFG